MAWYRRYNRYGRSRSYRRRYYRRRGLFLPGPSGVRQRTAYRAVLRQLREERRKWRAANPTTRQEIANGIAAIPAGEYALTGLGDYEFKGTPSVGARIGAWTGDKLGSWLGRITGLGDYEGAPNPMPSIQTPAVRNQSDRSVVVSHREYIGDVVTSPTPGGFQLMSFRINPGNPVVFPWLSNIAPCFQEYKLNGCLFHFKSMSADALNSTNTALGQVICATNYNVAQANYQNKFEMENTEFGSSSKPSESIMHPIECDRRLNVLGNLYIAPGGSPPEGSDPQFYEHANFQLATNGFQGASVNIGELWVTYEVILRKPIQPEAQGSSGGLLILASNHDVNLPVSLNQPMTTSIFTANQPPPYVYPAGSLNPTSRSGLDYFITTAGTTVTLQSANNPQSDSSLVGRIFHFEVSILMNAGGAFTPAGSAIGAPTVSSNLRYAKVLDGNDSPQAAVTVNGSGNIWALNNYVLVTGSGPISVGWDPANQYKIATSVFAWNITVTEVSTIPFRSIPV